MANSMDTDFFEQQHCRLVEAVNNNRHLGDLIFQGQSLNWHASTIGFEKLLEAVHNNWLDPIALNHSIKRYCINNYKHDLIWDYPNLNRSISFDDAFINDLNSNFELIKSEIFNIIELAKKFPDSDTLTNSTGQWNFIPFFEKDGTSNSSVLKKCPTILSLIKNQKINTELGFVFVSVLEKRSSIAAHSGSTALRKRYHLPIVVPEAGKSKIRIGSRWIEWEPGRAFSFYDAENHEVMHDADSERILLIVDVWPEELPDELVYYLKENTDILKYATDGRQEVALND